MQIKKLLKKTWNFVWHEDSLLSWLVNIIIAFVLVKFVIYPGLGFLLATTHPLVAVVSSSMEHRADFESWWEANKEWYLNHGFTKDQFRSFPYPNGFNKGDIMVLVGTRNINIGDIIVYNGNNPHPIIHRVVEKKPGDKMRYNTKGDRNPQKDFAEIEGVIGKAVFRIPFLGWVKIFFSQLTGGV